MTRRRDFLTCSAAVTGALVLPDFGFGQKSADSKTEARMVPGNEGKRVWMTGIMVTIKADSHMTAGAYAVFEDLVLPGQGMRLHVHTREDETLYVLQGELQVVLGDQTYSARVAISLIWPVAFCRFPKHKRQTCAMVLSCSRLGLRTVLLTSENRSPILRPHLRGHAQDIRKRGGPQMYGVMAI
jgi:mannose-6-phosphate isomerase-like protein (cupin superfamily)